MAEHTAGDRGECHNCRSDVAPVDNTAKDLTHVIKHDEDSYLHLFMHIL